MMINSTNTNHDTAIAAAWNHTPDDPTTDSRRIYTAFPNTNRVAKLPQRGYLRSKWSLLLGYTGLANTVTQQIVSTRCHIETRIACADASSPKTQSTDSGSVPGSTGSDQGGRQAKGGSPSGPPSDKPNTGTQESEVESLPMDKVFEILKNSRRRQALIYLKENGGKASLSELAEYIAAIENDCSIRAISSSQRKRVYVGLYQCHLPKMDDMHIIDFEKNRGNITLGANAVQLDPYLGETQEFAWFRLYLGVTGVAIGMLGVSLLGSAPFGLTPLVVLLALLTAMACSAGAQAYLDG